MPRCIKTAAALVAVAVGLGAPSAGAAGAPQVSDTWATGVGANAVDLHGLVNPNGLATSARVEYITTAAYRANLDAVPPRDGFTGAAASPLTGISLGAGEADVAFVRHVGFLAASTAYRYRVVATNTATTSGAPRLFTTTENAPVFSLPDNRGWEMVSPPEKNGGEIQGPGAIYGGGVLQAAVSGGAVSFSSRASFGAPQAASSASQYVARRGVGGWSTQNVTVPVLAGAFGDFPDGVPYQLFSGDLGRGLIAGPQRCEGTAPCPRGYGLRGADGSLVSSPEEPDLTLAGAAPDLDPVVLSTCAALTADAIEVPAVGGGCDPAKANLYRWSGGSPTLVNLLPGAPLGTPGAALAAPGGAVSAGSSRVYFTVAGNLYLRQGAQTLQVDATVGGGGTFETAAADGALAFFTKTQLDGRHLYRFDAGTQVVTDLSPAGDVEGVLGASPDGSYLYYLTGAGLLLRHGATTTAVAASAAAGNYPPATGSARVAANGNLAFLASAALTEFDNHGIAEAYLYAPATATLTCASCNPSGARPLGPAGIPGAVANGQAATATRAYKPRALSSDGTRLFFDSRDSLATLDTNNDRDVYQWEAEGTGSCARPGGCIALISSGRATEGAVFLDASVDGADVFFLTDGSLVGSDPGVADVYDARVGGGFPEPPLPIACVADACQPVPAPADDPTPGTAISRAEVNPPLASPKAKKKKQKKHVKKRHHKQRKAHGKRAHAGTGARR